MKIRGQYVYPPEERITNNIAIDDKRCWNWTGSKRNGYGRLIVGSRSDGSRHSETAHRYSWLVFRGEIPDGYFVCHHCDNPACVNPEHLSWDAFPVALLLDMLERDLKKRKEAKAEVQDV